MILNLNSIHNVVLLRFFCIICLLTQILTLIEVKMSLEIVILISCN